MRALFKTCFVPGGVGIASFNLATAGGNTSLNAAVNSIRITVYFINKPNFKLFQEGFTVEPQRIFG